MSRWNVTSGNEEHGKLLQYLGEVYTRLSVDTPKKTQSVDQLTKQRVAFNIYFRKFESVGLQLD